MTSWSDLTLVVTMQKQLSRQAAIHILNFFMASDAPFGFASLFLSPISVQLDIQDAKVSIEVATKAEKAFGIENGHPGQGYAPFPDTFAPYAFSLAEAKFTPNIWEDGRTICPYVGMTRSSMNV